MANWARMRASYYARWLGTALSSLARFAIDNLAVEIVLLVLAVVIGAAVTQGRVFDVANLSYALGAVAVVLVIALVVSLVHAPAAMDFAGQHERDELAQRLDSAEQRIASFEGRNAAVHRLNELVMAGEHLMADIPEWPYPKGTDWDDITRRFDAWGDRCVETVNEDRPKVLLAVRETLTDLGDSFSWLDPELDRPDGTYRRAIKRTISVLRRSI